MPIVMACIDMARGKVGALIVIERTVRLDDIVETGDLIDANINQRLIENIFFKNSPLHDGAMIISKNASVPQDVYCPCRTVTTFLKNWDCAIVPHSAYRRAATP